jgi:hypothetical protein
MVWLEPTAEIRPGFDVSRSVAMKVSVFAFANSHAARLDAAGAGSIAARYWRMGWRKPEYLLLMTLRVENSEVADELFARFFAGDYSAKKSRQGEEVQGVHRGSEPLFESGTGPLAQDRPETLPTATLPRTIARAEHFA